MLPTGRAKIRRDLQRLRTHCEEMEEAPQEHPQELGPRSGRQGGAWHKEHLQTEEERESSSVL